MTAPLSTHATAFEGRVAVENVLARYAFAYDMDQLELLESCFSEEAEVIFSTGLQVGRSAVLAELARRRGEYRPSAETPWHVITNLFVRPAGEDHLLATSYFSFAVASPGRAMSLDRFGWYEDVFAHEANEWRIRRRRIHKMGASPQA